METTCKAMPVSIRIDCNIISFRIFTLVPTGGTGFPADNTTVIGRDACWSITQVSAP